MSLIARIFVKGSDVAFDVPLQGELPALMAAIRTDGFAIGPGFWVPYDQIRMVLTYEVGSTGTVIRLVPDPKESAS
jgi:hypothetical protein